MPKPAYPPNNRFLTYMILMMLSFAAASVFTRPPTGAQKAKSLLACKDLKSTHWADTVTERYYDCLPYGTIDLEAYKDNSRIMYVHAPADVCPFVDQLLKNSPGYQGCSRGKPDAHPEANDGYKALQAKYPETKSRTGPP